VSFGSVTVGSTNSQTMRISNLGTATLNLSQHLLAGTAFNLSGLSLPSSVSPGGAASFTVGFAPASAGSFLGSLTLVNNSPNSPVVLAFSGTGIASTPQLSVSPTSVSKDTLLGSGFTLSGLALPVTLSAGQSTSFNVAFAPTTAASYSATVTVTSNAVNSLTTISLAGWGTAPVTHSVTLRRTPSSSTFVGFNIYRGTVPGGPYTQINSALVSTPTYTDTNVTSGQTYYYVATQLNASGDQSAYSNETTAVIP
jgi:hypothetical protein